MKKTSSSVNHHKLNLKVHSLFEKNIGILGLVVVVLFLVMYMVLQKMDSMNNRIVELESGNKDSMNKEMNYTK